MRRLPGLLMLATLTGGIALAGTGLLQERAPVAGKSANWQVTVVKAAMYTKARISPYDPNQYQEPPVYKKDSYNLALELSFVYVGPPGEIAAPSLSAINENGEKFHALGNLQTSSSHLDGFEWLITLARSEPDKRALKGGEKFGDDSPITFYIADIPLASKEIKILFADVPPIPVKPTPLK